MRTMPRCAASSLTPTPIAQPIYMSAPDHIDDLDQLSRDCSSLCLAEARNCVIAYAGAPEMLVGLGKHEGSGLSVGVERVLEGVPMRSSIVVVAFALRTPQPESAFNQTLDAGHGGPHGGKSDYRRLEQCERAFVELTKRVLLWNLLSVLDARVNGDDRCASGRASCAHHSPACPSISIWVGPVCPTRTSGVLSNPPCALAG